jgi:hypothetical protein
LRKHAKTGHCIVKRKSISPTIELTSATHWPVGPKAFYLEPWLIIGSVMLWLAVLPLAGLVWSGTTLARRTHLIDALGSLGGAATQQRPSLISARK